jgi:hypothetical protein
MLAVEVVWPMDTILEVGAFPSEPANGCFPVPLVTAVVGVNALIGPIEYCFCEAQSHRGW